MRKLIFPLITLMFLLGALSNTNCAPSDTSSAIPKILSTEGKAAIGKPAPVFTWIGSDNIRYALTDYRGKLVIISTWDISCTVCTEFVLPYFSENYNSFSEKGITLLSINDGDSGKRLTEFLNGKNYPFTILSDEPKPEYKFRSPYLLKKGNPWIVLIDRNGILVNVQSPQKSQEVTDLIENFIKSN